MKKLLAVSLLLGAAVYAGQTGGGHPSSSTPPKLPPIPDCDEVVCIFV